MSILAWPLLLLASGLILLVAEVFIPSGGLIGMLAVGCLVVSLWQAFHQSFDLGVKFLLADSLLLPLAFAAGVYLWPKTPLARRVSLRPPGPDDIEGSHASQRLDHLVGQFGRTLTPMRPSGLVDFDGRRLDGISEEGFLAAGALIRAVRVRGGQLIVRAAPDPNRNEIDPDLTSSAPAST
jgi:membrane-bound ClpP family serine protease